MTTNTHANYYFWAETDCWLVDIGYIDAEGTLVVTDTVDAPADVTLDELCEVLPIGHLELARVEW